GGRATWRNRRSIASSSRSFDDMTALTTLTLEPRAELRPRAVAPHPHRLQLDVEEPRDLLARELFDLEQDEDGAIFLLHPVEELVDKRGRLPSLQLVDGRGRRAALELARCLVAKAVTPLAPAPVARHVGGDAVEPGREIGLALAAGQLGVNDQEHVVHHVFGV